MYIDSETKAFCTSTLIGSKELSSAAHCFMNKNKTGLDFVKNLLLDTSCLGYVGCTKVSIGLSYLGAPDYEDEEVMSKINIIDVYVHESYFDPNAKFFVNDVSLLILEKEVILDEYTNVASLASAHHTLSQQGTILGWGQTAFNANTTSSELRYGNVTILGHENCQQTLDYLNVTIQLSNGIICSHGVNVNGSSPCKVRFQYFFSIRFFI